MTKDAITAVGRRKSAIARVTLVPGKGEIICSWPLTNPALDKEKILSALDLVGLKGKYNLKINLIGGGYQSRVDAIKLGVARALVKLDETNKTTLRKAGLLTRDPREKERKKPGLRRARRAPQWAKR